MAGESSNVQPETNATQNKFAALAQPDSDEFDDQAKSRQVDSSKDSPDNSKETEVVEDSQDMEKHSVDEEKRKLNRMNN
ncbi:hypothetical protein TSUD_375830 [Trifolium subterraneum]|uniref:Uncharacterized protein n=1 Tax=Trifolium subterraneum TaxID=3900 RepID=A0A2Z6MP65_TRISU|nr:hypothetical protein TSUD_375830 [Trifolium subterraneum]